MRNIKNKRRIRIKNNLLNRARHIRMQIIVRARVKREKIIKDYATRMEDYRICTK